MINLQNWVQQKIIPVYRVGQKLGGSDTISACVSLPPNFWPTLYFKRTKMRINMPQSNLIKNIRFKFVYMLHAPATCRWLQY